MPTLWQGISPGSLERIVATAHSIARSTYAPHRNLGIGLHHIPGASGFPGRAPGAGGQGRRHRVGATNIQQRMPDLPHDQGDNRLGPNLHNIIGRKAGSLQNYGYSSAMKGADFVWDKEKLDRFIAKPDEVVPGNNMKPYGGLTSAEDRARVVMFLESPTTN